MTPAERADVDLIDGSRRARIAKGSGSDPGEVGQLVKQFKEMQKLMKRMPGISGTKKALGKGKKGKKAKKGGRVTASPTGPQNAHKPTFTLPGLTYHPSTTHHGPPHSCVPPSLTRTTRSGPQPPPYS